MEDDTYCLRQAKNSGCKYFMDKKTITHIFFNSGGRETSRRDLTPSRRLPKQIVSARI